MENIYQLLSRLEIDNGEFTEAQVDEVEVARVKARLNQSIRKKRSVRSVKKLAIAAVMGLSSLAVGFSFPQASSQLPVIGQIFSFFDEDQQDFHDGYKFHTTPLDITRDSHGIRLTVEDALFDGQKATVTFTLQSNYDLGPDPWIDNFRIKGVHALGGSSKITRLNSREYKGIMTGSLIEGEQLDTAEITWEINEFTIYDGEDSKVLDGDWEFDFVLAAPNRKTKVIDQTSRSGETLVTIVKMISTPYGFTIYYNQSSNTNSMQNQPAVALSVEDDLGNVYASQGNGGYGTESTGMNRSTTFTALDPNATKVFVTPSVYSGSHPLLQEGLSHSYNTNSNFKEMVIEIESE